MNPSPTDEQPRDLSSDTIDSWQVDQGDEVIDGCVVREVLGSSSRFEVYLAFDEQRLCPVAVKVLRPSHCSQQSSIDRFAREITITEQLRHPVIVRSLGASLSAPRPYLCLEWLAGPSVSSYLDDEGPIGIPEAVSLAMEVSSGLHYMHASGFAHCDITPRNVILGSPPRLIDFSLARPLRDMDFLSAGTGTKGYRAPEVEGPELHGPPGPHSDIWGLGATLKRALATPSGNPPSHAPAPLKALIVAMLDPHASARPTAAEVFDAAEALMAALPAPDVGFFRP